jgi:hypothetical protein
MDDVKLLGTDVALQDDCTPAATAAQVSHTLLSQ